MLRLMEFLVEVTSKNIKDIKSEMVAKLFKCDRCDFETDTNISLLGHSRKHKDEVENTDLQEVTEAVPQGNFKSRAGNSRKMSIEEEEGVGADGKTDSDGTVWVGKGVEEDSSGFVPRAGSK